MGYTTRPELSKNNPWWISKHRYFELKHFCLQYHEWESICKDVKLTLAQQKEDPTGCLATKKTYYEAKMRLVKDTAYNTDTEIGKWIFIGVTDDRSYNYLKMVLNIPCGKDMYYDRYRKFFWLLSELT